MECLHDPCVGAVFFCCDVRGIVGVGSWLKRTPDEAANYLYCFFYYYFLLTEVMQRHPSRGHPRRPPLWFNPMCCVIILLSDYNVDVIRNRVEGSSKASEFYVEHNVV